MPKPPDVPAEAIEVSTNQILDQKAPGNENADVTLACYRRNGVWY